MNSIVIYDDYGDDPSPAQELVAHPTLRKVVVPDSSYEEVFEQYELNVPCYENDTSLPELVSASVRPISEFYNDIPKNAERVYMQTTSYGEESAERPIQFVTSNAAPSNAASSWQMPSDGELYDTILDDSDEFIQAIYQDQMDGSGKYQSTTSFSPDCVYEEHYVFDVFEKEQEKTAGDDNWTGPIITEVTDSGDEDEKKVPEKTESICKEEPPVIDEVEVPACVVVDAPLKSDRVVTVANHAGVLTGSTNQHIDVRAIPRKLGGISPDHTIYRDDIISRFTQSNGFVKEFVDTDDRALARWQQPMSNEPLGTSKQLLPRDAQIGRGLLPNRHPQAFSEILFKENLPMPNNIGRKINMPGYSVSTIFAVNENIPPGSFSLLNSINNNEMIPSTQRVYGKSLNMGHPNNQQRQQRTNRHVQTADPYGDGILTAISDHNKLIDQYPSMMNADPYRPVRRYPANGQRLLLDRRPMAPDIMLNEQQNRYRMLRGFAAGNVRHTGMQNMNSVETWSQPQVRRRNFYRAPGERFFNQPRRAQRSVPYGQAPFDKVNVTVSARPHNDRTCTDETTEVLEKLNDIYHYVLTKPTVGKVNTKIEEVHQSTRSGHTDDPFSLSDQFFDYSMRSGKLKPPLQLRYNTPAVQNRRVNFMPNGIRNVKVVPPNCTIGTIKQDRLPVPKQNILDLRDNWKISTNASTRVKRPIQKNERCFEF